MTSTAHKMTDAAAAFIESLAPEQRAKASFSFDDANERRDWAYFPRDHKGLSLLDMRPSQQKRAHALIACSISQHAYGKVTTVMGLESVLNDIENRERDAARDPGRYFLSVFGSPRDERWGWRLEGHHVSLNFTLAGGEIVATTPLFLGANPAELRHGEVAVVRPCGEEEDVARHLLSMLSADQRRQAIIYETAPPDLVLTNRPFVPESSLPGEAAHPFIARLFEGMSGDQKQALRFSHARPEGLSSADMDGSQRSVLGMLVDVYLDRLPPELARLARGRIESVASDLWFAWAGDAKRARQPHYYRVQGPTFLVEYDNTQDEANHVHAVWRDPRNDFGRDALGLHLAQAH